MTRALLISVSLCKLATSTVTLWLSFSVSRIIDHRCRLHIHHVRHLYSYSSSGKSSQGNRTRERWRFLLIFWFSNTMQIVKGFERDPHPEIVTFTLICNFWFNCRSKNLLLPQNIYALYVFPCHSSI